MNSREECPMRHRNGNCLVIGGFCTSVNDEYCNGLREAYECGALREMRRNKLDSIEQPQPGMWVYCEDDYGQDGYQCTNCGFFEPWYYKYEGINFIHKYKRCPGCGSAMTEMSYGEVGE